MGRPLTGKTHVDYVAATGNASASKWTTETTRRDQLFLKMLGVK